MRYRVIKSVAAADWSLRPGDIVDTDAGTVQHFGQPWAEPLPQITQERAATMAASGLCVALDSQPPVVEPEQDEQDQAQEPQSKRRGRRKAES